MQFYLLNLSVCGIKNIETPVEISFYKKTINNDFDPQKYRIKAIYGENGSGKTAIITAVKILKNLLINRNYLGDNETQKSLLETVNKKMKKGSIECEFYFSFNAIKFIIKYGVTFEIKEDGRFYITGEKIEYKNGKYMKNRYVTALLTENGVLRKFGEDKETFDFFYDKTANLLDKQSFVSTCAGFDSIPKDYRMYDSFIIQGIVFLFSFELGISIDESDDHSSYILKKNIGNVRGQTTEGNTENSIDEIDIDYINRISTKILNIKDEKLISKQDYEAYKKQTERLSAFVKIFKPELNKIKIETKDYGDSYKCELKMVYDDYTIDREFESRGIKKIMDLFDYIDSACSGSIVFIDELDANISDVYLDKMIEYFKLYGKGQLCFTAHNLSPMNVLRDSRNAIDFISGINTVHTWTRHGNMSPENAYRNGFIEDSPFNVDASDFLGILGDADE